MTMPMAAISSSACTIANVALPVSLSMRYFRMYSMSDSQSDDDGVIGYQPTTVTPAMRQPMAAAALPSMMILPVVSFIRSTRSRSWGAKCAFAWSKPALSAPRLRASARCFFPSWRDSAFSISAMSMPSRCASTPS